MRQEDLKLKVNLTYTGRSFLTSKVPKYAGSWVSGVTNWWPQNILPFRIQHKAQTEQIIQRLEALAALTENPVCILFTKTQKQLRLLKTGWPGHGGTFFTTSIQEAEAGGPSWVWDHSGLHSELQSAQGYIVNPVSRKRDGWTRLKSGSTVEAWV